MSKGILGDDPFGGGTPDEEAAVPAAQKKARKETAAPKKKARKKGPAAASEPESAATEAAEASEPAELETAAPLPPTDEAEPLPPPPAGAAPTGSGYGPSIDEPPSEGALRGLYHHVRDLEQRVRERFAPAQEERRRLPLEFVWKRVRAVQMRDRSDVVDEFGRDPQVAARFNPLLDFLYQRYFRVECDGMGHIPQTGRALLVSNHSGTLPYDGAMIMHAVRRDHPAHRPVRPLVEDFVFHFPYLGTLMNRIGGVRACQENAERLLSEDQLVAVFPEGIKGIGKVFAQRYQLQRFGRGGFIKLALSCDAPIIPTAVVGAEEIHPMFTKVTWLAKSVGIPYIPITPTFPWLGPVGLLPLPTKWYLAFGEPLYFNVEYGAEGAHDRILVNKLAEQVRQRIQDMIDALLKKRRSVLFG